MREIVIVPRREFRVPVEAERISPDVFASRAIEEIGRIEVWEGNKKSTLSDLFDISGDGSPEKPEETLISLSGDFSRVKRVGEKMTGGRILAQGDLGMHAGNGMAGGAGYRGSRRQACRAVRTGHANLVISHRIGRVQGYVTVIGQHVAVVDHVTHLFVYRGCSCLFQHQCHGSDDCHRLGGFVGCHRGTGPVPGRTSSPVHD